MSHTMPGLPILVGTGRDESHPVPPSQVTMTQLVEIRGTRLPQYGQGSMRIPPKAMSPVR